MNHENEPQNEKKPLCLPHDNAASDKAATNYKSCDNQPDDDASNRSRIKLHHIILIAIGQIFIFLQGKSYKIYSGCLVLSVLPLIQH